LWWDASVLDGSVQSEDHCYIIYYIIYNMCVCHDTPQIYEHNIW